MVGDNMVWMGCNECGDGFKLYVIVCQPFRTGPLCTVLIQSYVVRSRPGHESIHNKLSVGEKSRGKRVFVGGVGFL